MIHKACMPVYMNSGKIVVGRVDGKIEGSTRGPCGPKKLCDWNRRACLTSLSILIFLGHSSGNIRYVQAGDTENSPRV